VSVIKRILMMMMTLSLRGLDSHYQYTFDAVYVYVVPWSEFPIVPSYPHYPQGVGVR